MTITSTAFQHNELIPIEYTCEGKNYNPPLTFSEVPVDAKSLVLIMDDPDAPQGIYTHWLLYNMSPATMQLLENSLPITGQQGVASFGAAKYGGPCPPSGTHRYIFKLYALSTMLDLPEEASREEIEAAMEDQIIDTAELIGLYAKENESSETLRKQDLTEITDDRDTSDGQLISS